MILIMTFQDLSRIVFKVIVCQEKGFFRDHLLKLCVVFILITSLIVANFSDSQKYHEPQNSLMSFQETFQFNDHPKNLNNTIYNFKDGKKPKWNLPHFVWIFRNLNEEIIENFNTFRQLNVLNTKHFAEQGNYSIKQINQENYHQHLSNKSSQKVSSVIKFLEERLKDEKNQNSHKQILENKELIIKRLIIYLVLLEKGGIFVDQMTTVVEGFDTWIEDIMNVVDINLGDRNDPNFKPKCFGFYNKEFSSLRMRVDVRREFEFEKKMVVFPSLEDDLIACEEQTEFMTKLVESYLEILFLREKSTRLQTLNKNQKLIGRTYNWQPYKYGHLLALHSILQQRQHFLNQESKSEFKKLAIDDYGFVTINGNIALNKLKNNLGVRRELYAVLVKLQLKYLPQLNGRLRFAHKLNSNITAYFTQQLNSELNPPEFFLENSFIHTFLLRFWPKGQKFKDYRYVIPINDQRLRSKKQMIELSEPQIMPQLIESENNENNPQWQSFEKNLWVIWDKGLKGNSNLIAELCFQNLKKSAANSGYKLNLVTENNIHEFLDKQTLQRIDFAVKHGDYKVQQQGLSDLWRLALIYKHGGVYIDATTFTTEVNLDFIQNITRAPSGLIWNRYGKQPKNLIFWNTPFGQPSNWQIDYKYKTKKQWHLSYESNFIAAQKGSELIGAWFDQFLQWIVTDYETIEQQMRQVNMWNSRWIRKTNRYLTVMDSIKYVIGRKEKQLKDSNNSQYQSASQYYQIWGMSGNMIGQQKFRAESNYENMDYRLFWADRQSNNLYRYQFSKQNSQEIIGPLTYQTKFFGFDSREINMIFEKFAIDHNYELTEERINQIVHPNSLMGKLLRIGMQNSIRIINYYAKLRQIKTKFRTSSIVGCTI